MHYYIYKQNCDTTICIKIDIINNLMFSWNIVHKNTNNDAVYLVSVEDFIFTTNLVQEKYTSIEWDFLI